MKNYIKDIIGLFASHDYAPGMRNKVQSWMADEEHRAEKDEALRHLWDDAHAMGMPEGMGQSLRTMRRNLNLPATHSTGTPAHRLWRAAAIVLMAVSSASVYWAASEKAHRTADLVQSYIPCADMRTLTLPDGTQVTVNSETTLLYPETFQGETRSVYLIGEANFKVKPDKKHPFIVKSSGFQVTALGTEFQVSAYPSDKKITATLLSGSVKVEYNNLQGNAVLKPSEQLVYDKDTKRGQIGQPDMGDCTAWQRGELVLRSMELEDIITRLERKYPYTFIYSPNGLNLHDTYSFRFPAKTSMEEIMDIITQVMDLDYKIEGHKCYLTKSKRK